MTNYEKIKAAKDEKELARFFDSVTSCRLCAYRDTERCDLEANNLVENPTCIEGIYKWLKNEAYNDKL